MYNTFCCCDGLSPNGKATDSDSVIFKVRILVAQLLRPVDISYLQVFFRIQRYKDGQAAVGGINMITYITFPYREETVLCVVILLVLAAALAAGKTYSFRRYRKSEYRMETRRRRRKVENDRGAFGEYETSMALEKIRGRKKFVFNAYIPKANGRGSVETDIIMIHEKGIFVIENKNYSGVVAGRADREYWSQFLAGRRYLFYSPVYQNFNHVRHIKAFLENNLEEIPDIPVFSAVVFNDKAKFLKIRKLKKTDAIVCHSRKVKSKIRRKLRHQDSILDENEIDKIYLLLKSRAEVFRWVKRSHRKKVEKYKKST